VKLEHIIASTCRQKILLALSKVKKTHVTNLVRMTNSTYNEVRRNIEIMEKEGILSIQRYGNMKIVQLELSNTKTERLLKALRTLRAPDLFLNAPKSQNEDTQNAQTYAAKRPLRRS